VIKFIFNWSICKILNDYNNKHKPVAKTRRQRRH